MRVDNLNKFANKYKIRWIKWLNNPHLPKKTNSKYKNMHMFLGEEGANKIIQPLNRIYISLIRSSRTRNRKAGKDYPGIV